MFNGATDLALERLGFQLLFRSQHDRSHDESLRVNLCLAKPATAKRVQTFYELFRYSHCHAGRVKESLQTIPHRVKMNASFSPRISAPDEG